LIFGFTLFVLCFPFKLISFLVEPFALKGCPKFKHGEWSGPELENQREAKSPLGDRKMRFYAQSGK
jgi:hypothetical protein